MTNTNKRHHGITVRLILAVAAVGPVALSCRDDADRAKKGPPARRQAPSAPSPRKSYDAAAAMRNLLEGSGPAAEEHPATQPADVRRRMVHRALKRYKDARGNARYVIRDAIRQGRPWAVDCLIREADERGDTAAVAIELLGSPGGKKAMDVLVGYLAPDAEGYTRVRTYYYGVLADALDKIDPNWRRSPAARKLGGEWLEVLKRLIAEPDPKRRGALPGVVSALGHLRERRAVAALLGLIEPLIASGDFEQAHPVIEPVTEALTRLDPKWLHTPAGKTALAFFLEQLGRDDPGIGWSAAAVLGRLGDRRAVGPMVAMIRKVGFGPSWVGRTLLPAIEDPRECFWRSPRHLVRPVSVSQTGLALARLVGEGDLAWLAEWIHRRRDGVGQMALVYAKVGREKAVKVLTELCRDPKEDFRMAGMAALAVTGSGRSVPVIAECLRSASPHVRARAAWLLGKLGAKSAAGELAELLRDEDETVRVLGAWALVYAGNPVAVGALIGALEDEDARVRMWAMEALGRIAGRGEDRQATARAVGALTAILAQESGPKEAPASARGAKGKQIRRYDDELDQAAEALGKTGDPRAIRPLLLAFAGGRARALPALARIDPLWPRGDEAHKSAAELISLLAAGARWHTIYLLGVLGDRRALQPLLGGMGAWCWTRELARGLDRLDPTWRTSVAALEHVPRLLGMLTSAKPKAREPLRLWYFDAASAAYFLGELGDRRAVEPLLAHFRAAPVSVEADWRSVTDRAAGGLTDEEGFLGQCAVALGKLGDARAVEPLVAPFRAVRVRGDPPRRPRTTLPFYAPRAAIALGSLGDRRALQPLLRVCRAERMSLIPSRMAVAIYSRGRMEPLLVAAVTEAVARLGGSEADLIAVVKLVSPPGLAAKTLARLGIRRAVDPLIATLAPPDGEVCPDVVAALDVLDSQWRSRPTARKIVRDLLEQLIDVDSAFRTATRSYREQYSGFRSPVATVLDALSPQWRSTPAVRDVRQLLRRELLRRPAVEVAVDCVDLLGHLGGRESAKVIFRVSPHYSYDEFGWFAGNILRDLDPDWRESKRNKLGRR